MNYKNELEKAKNAQICIDAVYIASQVEEQFSNLTDEQFEKVCDIIEYCLHIGKNPIEDTINFILQVCYYSYDDDIELFLSRHSAEEVKEKMRDY